MDIHANYGGVVPEIASRSHIESITIVLDELLKNSNMKMDDIDFIGVTYGPGLIGSLLIGVEAAKTLADVRASMKINYFDDQTWINECLERFSK